MARCKVCKGQIEFGGITQLEEEGKRSWVIQFFCDCRVWIYHARKGIVVRKGDLENAETVEGVKRLLARRLAE